jgi:hypothetical protein
MGAPRGNDFWQRRALTPLQRFLDFCRFEPETGCVIWIGSTSMGRGHHDPYGTFWADNRRWFAHRWSAKNIHGLEIDGLQVDHFCPHIPHPNTLCVEHVQPMTLLENRELQALRAFERRKKNIHLQVGLLKYEDVYGAQLERDPNLIPFFTPPAWLGTSSVHRLPTDCPF